MSLVYNYTFLTVDLFLGQSGDWIAASSRVILPTTFINVAILVPGYFIFQIFNKEPRRTLYAWR